ncbi:MAG TPA: mannose-1-phosphate guanylyltransferase/mannose-6-phosphate isomerase [Gammaproteobacteria bacterium]
MKLTPVILSGGSGSRLWPVSRELYPKQLLALVAEQTMLQETVQRLEGLEEHQITLKAPVVVCNEEHRFLVAEQLRAIAIEEVSIILEPVGRNTAPALTLAALGALRDDDDAILLVMPADHVIRNSTAFRHAVAAGSVLAEQRLLVTFGIVPTTAETGYGYIRKGGAHSDTAHAIAAFVEKPDAATAQSYFDSGDYLWNSGMFMMRASVWLEQVGQHRPDILAACRTAWAGASPDHDFCRIDKAAFTACPSDSIDYAVMERVGEQGVVVPLDAGWSDVGAWNAVWDVLPKDEQGNVIRGDVLAHNTNNSMLMGNSRLLAVIGVDDLLVIETSDAVLVANKNNAQDVKTIVQTLQKNNRSERLLHRRVHRPWGTYEAIDQGERHQVKRITVNPGAALSLQLHHHRAEHWVVVQGTATVTRGDEVFVVTENQSTYIPIGVKHRLENSGKVVLEIIEVQSGAYLGEDDIVRFEDIYGRSPNQA